MGLIASVRQNPWPAVIVMLQLIIIAMVSLGIGEPAEVYASNVEDDTLHVAALAEDAANEARSANATVQKMYISGVDCSSM